jgi:hypothetical protein
MSHHDEQFHVGENAWELMLQKLDDIHAEVRKTNGRVSGLEKWQSWITGALALLGISLPIIGFFFLEIYKKVWK